jgi:carboxyl-terminal processing protease
MKKMQLSRFTSKIKQTLSPISPKWAGVSALTLIGLLACVSPISGAKVKSGGDYYENLTRLNNVFDKIKGGYVENVDFGELTDAAISGMRTVLDPHTAIFNPKDFGDLKVQTEGKFGGLGIQIAMRDGILTVMSPIPGTPAERVGIKAGDRIVKIDGVKTLGLEIDEAVDKMRGKPKTDVTISIWREGFVEAVDYKITREEIIVHSVPYYGMTQEPGVGYIKLVQFQKNTASEMANAIQKLQAQGMKKLILDLRQNPGGLLDQAIAVSELFLKKGQLIVSTKGRNQQSEARSSTDPLVDPNLAIAVLVNEGSASAAEIVSGALQDWDRAVILGKTSFGKGSVQSIMDLDNNGYAMKMTTAFYYLPQGRCVNRPENGIRDEEHLKADSSKADSTKFPAFYTAGGRKVYGGGGVTPDIESEAEHLNSSSQLLERQSMFFKFVIKNRPKWEAAGMKASPELKIEDAMITDFITFTLADTSFTKAKSGSESALEMLNDVISKERAWSGEDTTTKTDDVYASLALVKKTLMAKRQASLALNKEYIREGLKREILGTFNGEKARTQFALISDKQVNDAISVLKDEKRYKATLSKGYVSNVKPVEDKKKKK